ncbi:MAG: hypothetical protein JNL57_10075 [Bacteroidetes bacterium]|nr:hypothetical protein [Bacteroidota bacterium]
MRIETDDTIYLVKVSAKPKEVLTEEQMDELVKPSAKDTEEPDAEGESEEDSEDDGNQRKRGFSDDDE